VTVGGLPAALSAPGAPVRTMLEQARPCQTQAMASEPASERERRRRALRSARLYLICPCELGPERRALPELLSALIEAGVDVVQLRDKEAADERLLAVARQAAAAARGAGALLVINDRPELARAAGADGVHLGQDDLPVSEARRIGGADLVVGVSTHTPAQVDEVGGADYIGVGPVHATPTKPGRPGVGLGLVSHAARVASCPWFAIGGIDAANVGAVLGAGARRVAVVRAIAAAPDPVAAARALRTAIDQSSAHGTPAQPAARA